jgi:hypothetical protein
MDDKRRRGGEDADDEPQVSLKANEHPFLCVSNCYFGIYRGQYRPYFPISSIFPTPKKIPPLETERIVRMRPGKERKTQMMHSQPFAHPWTCLVARPGCLRIALETAFLQISPVEDGIIMSDTDNSHLAR